MADAPRSSWTDRVWILLPYVLLVASAVLTLLADGTGRANLPVLVGGSVALLAWHTGWFSLRPGILGTRLLPSAVYYVGLVALCAVLLHQSFNFFPLYVVCFPLAFDALPGRWAYVGVALTSGVVIAGPGDVTPTVENTVVTLAAGLVAGLAGWSIRTVEHESARRRAAVTALAAANDDLARSVEENRSLQGRLLTEARSSGVASERARLAGEIHDTLAAGLAGVVAQLEALDAELGEDHPARGRVRTSVTLARDGLAEARRSVRALRPGPLAHQALPAALAESAARVQRTHGLPVTMIVTGEEREVAADVEDVLVRSAREALSNVVRHARATEVRVTLSYLDDAVALDVADDGTGTTPAPDDDDGGSGSGVGSDGGAGAGNVTGTGSGSGSGSGQGLAFMRGRAETAGGTMTVDSTPGEGTVITVTVPAAPDARKSPNRPDAAEWPDASTGARP
ncbi:sensor histidine kinase [Georgenia sp. Z1344]|uniref:sensor histidine kinase n=1 Tax=Georgenia sp. Z1344 TaxID=3416706 RepID=UPI003CEBD918